MAKILAYEEEARQKLASGVSKLAKAVRCTLGPRGRNAVTDPFRADAVEEFLRSGRMFSVADMVQLQNGDLSIPARSLVPLLRDLPLANAASRDAAARLLHCAL